MKKIVMTGGGSAGHVTGNLAILPTLRENGWSVEYIGSHDGIEKEIISQIDVPYHGIATGKLRRYFDLKNFRDPFRVVQGVVQAYFLLRKIKPQVVFSKGGFVAVPVVIAAWLNRIPVIIHESDLTPGLANRLSIPFAKKVCVTFPETLQHLPREKAVHTGSPIREEVFHGQVDRGIQLCGFPKDKPVLLVMGGSLGSQKINQTVRSILDRLLQQFHVVHICGKGNISERLNGVRGYKQFEYLQTEITDVFAMADLVVSRAGSNSIFEFLALQLPNVLIPLSLQASRGDQIQNARSFAKMGYSYVLMEEDLTPDTLYQAIQHVHSQKDSYRASMEKSGLKNAVQTIVGLIEETAKG